MDMWVINYILVFLKNSAFMPLKQALVIDLKKTLLFMMEELLNQGLKIQTLQVWKWFMRLLGPYGMKNKHLVNKLLKIPEQTFTDLDPQIQNASLVCYSSSKFDT